MNNNNKIAHYFSCFIKPKSQKNIQNVEQTGFETDCYKTILKEAELLAEFFMNIEFRYYN
jgi:hypothetical protein